MSYLDFNRTVFPICGAANAWEPDNARIQAILLSIQPMALGNRRAKDVWTPDKPECGAAPGFVLTDPPEALSKANFLIKSHFVEGSNQCA
jgi:hypothetical protein